MVVGRGQEFHWKRCLLGNTARVWLHVLPARDKVLYFLVDYVIGNKSDYVKVITKGFWLFAPTSVRGVGVGGGGQKKTAWMSKIEMTRNKTNNSSRATCPVCALGLFFDKILLKGVEKKNCLDLMKVDISEQNMDTHCRVTRTRWHTNTTSSMTSSSRSHTASVTACAPESATLRASALWEDTGRCTCVRTLVSTVMWPVLCMWRVLDRQSDESETPKPTSLGWLKNQIPLPELKQP